METREWNRSRGQSWFARIIVGALVVLLVVGLWEGYGRWLLAGAGANAT